MAVMDDRNARMAREAVALARKGAEGIQEFDAAAARLGPAETSLALREAGRQLQQAHQQLGELRQVADALAQLNQATAYRAVVLEVASGNGAHVPGVYVALIGQPQQLVAGLLPDVQLADLEVGDEVEVVRSGPDEFAVRRRVGRHLRFGAVGRLDLIEGPELVRLSMGYDDSG